MNKVSKKVLLISAILSVTGIVKVYSQQNHFIYIQADDKQQFNVSLKGKTFSASSIGYVIIPKLEDGKYMLTIGFPGKKYSDQEFECVISKADAGYSLKNFGKKGWGLFNLQTLDVTMAGTPIPELKKDTAKASGFGDMLADVVNDSSIKIVTSEKPVAVEKKQQPPVIKTGSAIIAVTENKLPVAVEPVITKPDPKIEISPNKAIVKVFEQQTDLGTDMMFVVNDGEKKDTVRILLPQLTVERKETDQSVTVKAVPDSVIKPVAESKEVNATEEIDKKISDTTASSNAPVKNPFFGEEKQKDAVKDISAFTDDKTNKNIVPNDALFKHDCKNMLSDEDLNKLRKKMFSITGDQKMTDIAKKYFEGKCVSSVQVKTLSGLFLSDESRYNFFAAAYDYVYDSSNFAFLENQLIDPLYKKRFLSLLK